MRQNTTSMEGWHLPAKQLGLMRKMLLLTAATIGLATVALPGRALGAEAVIAAAGELVCDPLDPYVAGATATRCQQAAVSDDIVADTDVDAFLPLGNLQNYCGGRSAFDSTYGPSFGRLNGIAYPVPGAIEYRNSAVTTNGTDCSAPNPNPAYVDPVTTPGVPQYLADTAPGYFGYWGANGSSNLPADATNPAKGYYTYTVGSWTVLAINTNEICKDLACRGYDANGTYTGSTQERWLRSFLAANANRCVIAQMNAPRWSSNLASLYTTTADKNDWAGSGAVSGIWRDLYDGGADVVLSSYARNYERFHPMNATGQRDDAYGVRQFVVGTGGIQFEANKTPIANSAAMYAARKFGYLRMVLKDGSYTWGYKDVDGDTFDAGSANCHGAPTTVTTPTAGANLPAANAVAVSAKVNAPGASDTVDFYVGSWKVGTAVKDPINCHTDITNDNLVKRAMPFCTYTGTINTRSVPTGKYSLRAVSNSTDPATPTAGTTGAIAVSVTNPYTGIASVVVGRSTQTWLGLPAGASMKEAAYSHARTKLAYTSPVGIVVVNANGTGATLVPGTAGATQPDWGPADAKLFYLKSGTIYSIPAAGGAATRLAVGKISGLSASPDGKRILYVVKMPNGKTDIFVMASTGASKKNITRTRLLSEGQPTWKTTTTIAFARKSTTWAVYTMPVAGGTARRITALSLNCRQPAYSPGGLRLACVTSLTSTTSIIRTMAANGTGVKTLPSTSASRTEPVWGSATVVAFTAK